MGYIALWRLVNTAIESLRLAYEKIEEVHVYVKLMSLKFGVLQISISRIDTSLVPQIKCLEDLFLKGTELNLPNFRECDCRRGLRV